MKKHIKLFVFILSILIVFTTYALFSNNKEKYYYIALGDSIAEGFTPNGKVEYGYPDYLKDYFEKENKLSFYTKTFAKSGYTTQNLIDDIENGREVLVDSKKLNIKKALRESNLVTVTIGANDFIRGISLQNLDSRLSDIKELKKEIDEITKKVQSTMELIKKYAKGTIILTGYYNPLPSDTAHKQIIDEIVKYANSKYEDICDDLNIVYVDIFDFAKQNIELLPSPFDIHPSVKGYEEISKILINIINSI